jgi:hypothetical protein
MAEGPQPPLPAGFQRPGVPGAGNILDPAVRGEIREKLHPAVHDAVRQVRDEQQPAVESPSEPPPAEAKQHRAGPYPHGDVDLSFIAANVPPEPVRPRRGSAGRRFYFLRDTDIATVTAASTEIAPAPPGPEPG